MKRLDVAPAYKLTRESGGLNEKNEGQSERMGYQELGAGGTNPGSSTITLYPTGSSSIEQGAWGTT